jgi:hypothetical protein
MTEAQAPFDVMKHAGGRRVPRPRRGMMAHLIGSGRVAPPFLRIRRTERGTARMGAPANEASVAAKRDPRALLRFALAILRRSQTREAASSSGGDLVHAGRVGCRPPIWTACVILPRPRAVHSWRPPQRTLRRQIVSSPRKAKPVKEEVHLRGKQRNVRSAGDLPGGDRK